jgi:hypothetical protein
MIGGWQPEMRLLYMHSFALAVGGVQGSSSPAVIFISDQPPGCRQFLENNTFDAVRIKRAAQVAQNCTALTGLAATRLKPKSRRIDEGTGGD